MLRIAQNCELTLVSITPRYYSQLRLGVTPRSNAHRLQIAQNCDSHFCSLVLDWTVQSSPAFSGTGPDCSPRVSDRTVWSFYRSPFELETGLFFSQTGPYFSVQTAVPIGQTIRSGLFQRSTNKATVRTGPDRGRSNICYEVKILIRDIRKLPHIMWLVEAIADDARRQLSGKLQFVKNRKPVESSRIHPDDSILLL